MSIDKLSGAVGVRPLNDPAGTEGFGRFEPIPTSPSELAMEAFRRAGKAASDDAANQWGFPTFFESDNHLGHVAGAIFVRSPGAVWEDVPLSAMHQTTALLGDFGERMRQANLFQANAYPNKYKGAFPTYFHANYDDGRGIVCGTVFLTPECADWRDVNASQLGNPVPSDPDYIGKLFRGAQIYAKSLQNAEQYIGALPTMFFADRENGREFGILLIKFAFAKFEDVVVSTPPH
ncbi:hypothetical protein [Burkholderia ubonensis]|uniref:hypothetical protein n=1 Tax=Burkholderia ubonensis TaxID=101571 RepID=UPI000A5BA303|nr:hypothetical protein [Burkholderia ubonensis]